MKYTKRIIEKALKQYIDFFSVVGITGPRQSGKSTLLLNTLKDYEYITFDSYKNVELFYHDPERFIRIHHNKVIFDEVQKTPELFNYIKIAVDQDRDNPGKFVLTGSSQFSFIQKITESLAGRIGLLSLLPYQLIEIPKRSRKESIIKGCYPELVEKKYKLHEDWFSSYLETYLTRDVKTLSNISDIRDFQRLISLLAADTSQILNMSKYADNLGVDIKTIKRWLSILDASYIIFLVSPYYKNYGKRIVKSPKVYFYDTGLVSYLTGIDSYEHFQKGPMAGSLFENYVVSEIKKREKHYNTHSELFYYRTAHGVEIDLIIDHKSYKELIEIKHIETFKPKMLSALKQFLKKGDKGYLLYNGKDFSYDENIEVMNYKNYCLREIE